MDSKYFGSERTTVERQTLEDQLLKQLEQQDLNIQIPMVVAAYRTPSMKTRDARVLDFISTILSDGKVRGYTKT
jgi:hypothetical protein